MRPPCERPAPATRARKTVTPHINVFIIALVAISSTVLTSSQAAAQLPPPLPTFPIPAPPFANAQARVVEWDCPLIGTEAPPTPPVDPSPGGLVTDSNGLVWFATQLGQQRLVRFTPGAFNSQRETLVATCNWWNLWDAEADGQTPLPGETPISATGGLRIRPYSNQVFIRGTDELLRINTTTNQRTRWADELISNSDVAIYQNSSTHVYMTGSAALGDGINEEPTVPDPSNPFNDVLQRFTPGNNGSATIRRWEIGGGAGVIFLSGVAVNPSYSNLVYFSEPLSNSIGELNTNTNDVRRWNLGLCDPFDLLNNPPTLVCQPRQLQVKNGKVWVVTGSGHLVRIDPASNPPKMLVAPIPSLGVGDLGTGHRRYPQ